MYNTIMATVLAQLQPGDFLGLKPSTNKPLGQGAYRFIRQVGLNLVVERRDLVNGGFHPEETLARSDVAMVFKPRTK